ncbi:LpqN/LpqT family lipoprotein [Mycobacterium sp. IDR2000157661]|uniref:LpqN/LpqT family lipoprotein n=1 Tax=Mycobacterium sp. IDR2000157661 TaxID=2867005 RepID=UPI001EE9D7FF|nr:LpqN/LpqT family lipoprotein [Mycobacterium sp. IDR2000157661]ULE33945.1 LpqN/LpqT family lipoprotein [Mycobacterium sp. IDR2000157661]
MRSSLRANRVIAAMVAVVLGLGMAACGSDDETATSSPSPQTTGAPTSAPEQAAPEMTIAEYIQRNNITETPVRRGDPGAPTIELPVPPGWRDANTRAPEGAYTAMDYADPAGAADTGTIIAYVSKLTGNVDPAKILEYAPAEIQRLPGYEGPKVGGPTKVGGYDTTQIGGAYTKLGAKRAIGQMTTVIPAQDGTYVLQLNAESPGTPEQVQALTLATAFLAQQAKVTP